MLDLMIAGFIGGPALLAIFAPGRRGLITASVLLISMCAGLLVLWPYSDAQPFSDNKGFLFALASVWLLFSFGVGLVVRALVADARRAKRDGGDRPRRYPERIGR